jgi:hypothetical protein
MRKVADFWQGERMKESRTESGRDRVWRTASIVSTTEDSRRWPFNLLAQARNDGAHLWSSGHHPIFRISLRRGLGCPALSLINPTFFTLSKLRSERS